MRIIRPALLGGLLVSAYPRIFPKSGGDRLSTRTGDDLSVSADSRLRYIP